MATGMDVSEENEYSRFNGDSDIALGPVTLPMALYTSSSQKVNWPAISGDLLVNTFEHL